MYDINMDFSLSHLIFRLSIQIPGFLLAIVVHEAAHAYMASKFGDNTAKYYGRLSLNPAVHLDVVGTVIFPLIVALFGGAMFGWAKPVPVDARNFKKIRQAIFWVSFAGPLANIILAAISALLLSILLTHFAPDFYLFTPFKDILNQSVIVNIVLAVFNLIPWPPLDGSKMVSSFLDYNSMRKYESLANYSLIFFIFLMYTGALGYVLRPAIMMAYGMVGIFMNFLS